MAKRNPPGNRTATRKPGLRLVAAHGSTVALPAEVVTAIEVMLPGLGDAPETQQMASSVAGEFAKVLMAARHPMQIEELLCGALLSVYQAADEEFSHDEGCDCGHDHGDEDAEDLGVVDEFDDLEFDDEDDDDEEFGPTPDEAVLVFLITLFHGAVHLDSENALAVYRTLAAGAPDPVGEQAAAAAALIAATGAADKPWAETLGRPALPGAWELRDEHDKNSVGAVVLHFVYDRREHVIATMIDDSDGGAIEDIVVGDVRQGKELHAHLSAIARNQPGLVFEQVTAEQATLRVAQALRTGISTEDPGRLENLVTYLELLRSRIRRAAADLDLGNLQLTPGPAQALVDRWAGQVLTMKVAVEGITPPIWRRIQVTGDTDLDALSDLIRFAFGWSFMHEHAFEPVPLHHPDERIPEIQEGNLILGQMCDKPGAKLRYRYDFGDDWAHLITVEKIEPAMEGERYPRCLTGRRAAPPEDCGGVPGYQRLLAVLADPAHPEREETMEWLGVFDPEKFSAEKIDRRYARY